MTTADQGMFKTLTDVEMRRSTYVAVSLGLLLPPFVGGSLMGLIGFYPMPEFFLIFTSYTSVYIAGVIALFAYLTPSMVRFVIGLTQLEQAAARVLAQRAFSRLPWYLLGGVTLYSIGGALSADISLESMGYRQFSLSDHLYNQFGLIPVVLITSFPIFFYYIDSLGRYLGPRGISVTAVPMWAKLLMLGIVTPLLIDSLLIGYYLNRTGYFEWQTLLLWFSLMVLASGGTWLAWRSLQQGILPLQVFINTPDMDLAERARTSLMPLSLDEFGALTSRFAELLSVRNQLSGELHRAEQMANAILDHAGALVLVLDRDGRILRFNRACEELSGYSPEEAIGQYPWDMLLPVEDADQVRKNAFEALAGDPASLKGHYTNHWLTKSGDKRLLDWSNTVLLDDQGHMEFMISVGVDITEQALIEQTLRDSESRLLRFNEELEQRVTNRTQELQSSLKHLNETQTQLVQSEKMASLGGLVAGVAHEINTPVGIGVTAISHLQMKVEHYAARYQSGQLTRDDFEALLSVSAESSRIIKTNLDRAANLIRSFKQVAVDQTSDELRSFNLNEYLHEVLQSLTPKLKTGEHQVSIDCPENLLIYNHPGALSQVLTNLVMNSLIHGFEERRNGRIRIRVLENLRGGVRLQYSDDGKGITAENLQKIYEPFFTTQRGRGGSGLGMHIVFNLVTQTLGGTIECASTVGEGTNFHIEIPNRTRQTEAAKQARG